MLFEFVGGFCVVACGLVDSIWIWLFCCFGGFWFVWVLDCAFGGFCCIL